MSTSGTVRTDIILSMAHTPTEDYMQQIVDRVKSHEFRKKLYPSTVKRIWFYETAPTSAITYICTIEPAHVRDKDGPLPLDGIGNHEYNEHHPSFIGYDYAYKVTACWKVRAPIGLARMRTDYDIRGAPRGMVYTPARMMEDVKWEHQELLWED